MPIRGFARAIDGWGPEALGNIATIGLLLGLSALALKHGGVVRPLAIAYLGFSMLLGTSVWGRWENFSRVLLPGFTFGLVAAIALIREQTGLVETAQNPSEP